MVRFPIYPIKLEKFTSLNSGQKMNQFMLFNHLVKLAEWHQLPVRYKVIHQGFLDKATRLHVAWSVLEIN